MKKNHFFRKLSTTIIVLIITLMMVNPVFAEEVTAVCGETPTWEGSEDVLEPPSMEVSRENFIIQNPDTGEETEVPADAEFYNSGEPDDFRDLGEELDAGAVSIGLPTREEIAQNSAEVWAIEPGNEEASLYGECYHSEEGTHIQPVEVEMGDDPTPVREEANREIFEETGGDTPWYTR